MAKQYKIEVTQDDIDHAERLPSDCPISRAVKRALNTHLVFTSGAGNVYVGDEPTAWLNDEDSDKAHEFVSRYDKRFFVSPINLTLEILNDGERAS